MKRKLLKCLSVASSLLVAVTCATLVNPAQADPAARDYSSEDLRRLPGVTKTGEVTLVHSRDYFEIRTTRDDYYRIVVDSDAKAPWVNKGDRVEVRGKMDRDIIIASDVDKLNDNDNNNDNNNNNTTIRGEVTEEYSNGKFVIRTSNWKSTTVTSWDQDARRVRRGDVVEVTGDWRNQSFYGRSIKVLASDNGNGNDDDWQSGNNVTLRGRITSDVNRNNFDIRTDGGSTLRVLNNSSSSNRFGRNDRIKLYGRYRSSDKTFIASDVSVLDDNGPGNGWPGNNGNNNNRIDFRGRVISISNSRRMTVQSDRDKTAVTVNSNSDFDRDISKGDRVRVRGWGFGTFVQNATVELAGNSTNSNDNDDVHVKGTIVRTPGRNDNYFTVRKSDGKEFRIRYDGGGRLRKGDRVLVEGKTRNDVIYATNIEQL